MASHQQQLWIPAKEVRQLLLDLGPDPDWAEQLKRDRLAVDTRNPWDDPF